MRTYHSASGSSAEDLFIELFSDTFGAEKASYLYSQYPFSDIYQNSRFADFLIENGGRKVAIEIDDEVSHNPKLVSQNKFYDDLLKQNSMIYLGWDVYRWAVRQMQQQPETVKGTYLPEYKNIFDLYLKDSTTEPTQLSSKTGDDATSEFSLGEAVFYQNGTWAWTDLQKAGMKADSVGMIPIYIGAKGEEKQGLATGLGDEGGFAPKMKTNEDSLKYIMDAISAAGYEPGKQIGISLDVASSEFYNKETGKYHFEGDDREAGYMLDFYENLINEYPIVSIEDPFQEEGWEDWAKITKALGDRLQFVGDDLFVTNPVRLKKGIDMGAGNSLLVKLNQIGTVTETLDAIELATKNGFTSMVSHRSGETPDTTISDLAVAKNTRQIKTGAPARGERVAKYNRLLEIEEELGSTAQYAGYSAFKACKKYLAK